PVYTLAFLDLSIPADKVEAVFDDALTALLKQAREDSIAKLQAKAQSKGLDQPEQETLIKLLANK
ncbi:MAG: DNA primase, partial [Methylococcaceae bacterium]|nr:DNA primase [Methylococcaceae bacterium]